MMLFPPTQQAAADRPSPASSSRPSSRASTRSSATASSTPRSRRRSLASTPGPPSARPPTSGSAPRPRPRRRWTARCRDTSRELRNRLTGAMHLCFRVGALGSHKDMHTIYLISCRRLVEDICLYIRYHRQLACPAWSSSTRNGKMGMGVFNVSKLHNVLLYH